MAEPARIGGAAAYVTVEELLRARLSAVIGGWRGALESAVPTIAFVVLWTVTRDVRTAVLAAAAALVVLAVLRLLRRETLRFLCMRRWPWPSPPSSRCGPVGPRTRSCRA